MMTQQDQPSRIPIVVGVTGHRQIRPADEPILKDAVQKAFANGELTWPEDRSDFGYITESLTEREFDSKIASVKVLGTIRVR